MGSSQLGIGLTAGAKVSSIDIRYPTVIAGLGGTPALVQHLTVCKSAFYTRNHGVAALVAQEQVIIIEGGNNSVAVKSELTVVLQSVSLGQKGNTFFLTAFIKGNGGLGQNSLTLLAARVAINTHDIESIHLLTVEFCVFPIASNCLNINQQSATSVSKWSIESNGPNAILISSWSQCSNGSYRNIEQASANITISVNRPRGSLVNVSQGNRNRATQCVYCIGGTGIELHGSNVGASGYTSQFSGRVLHLVVLISFKVVTIDGSKLTSIRTIGSSPFSGLCRYKHSKRHQRCKQEFKTFLHKK